VGRITDLAGPDWAERYAYDPAGNITAATWPAPPGPVGAWAGPAAQGPRQYVGTLITKAGDIRYEHDACGRIILRQRTRDSRKPDTWRYQWDADGRLTGVTTPDGTAWRYLYDPLGRRIAKQRLETYDQVAEQTHFIWDGSALAEQVTTIFDSPAASLHGMPNGLITTWDYQPSTVTPLTQITTPGPNSSWDNAAQDQVDSQFYAIVTDLIGAPCELVTPEGDLAGYQQRTLWGTTLWHPNGASTPLRFPGQYADDETGLHYNYHRYYDPATGRYLTPDPLGLTPAPNPHTYVSNPTLLIDPLGLSPYTIASRMRAAGPGDDLGLPSEGRIRYVPPRDYNPASPLPRGDQNGYLDRFGNEWVVGSSRTPGEPFEWDVQPANGRDFPQFQWLREGDPGGGPITHLNVSLRGRITHLG
jgi:RHS repeat-associated protein